MLLTLDHLAIAAKDLSSGVNHVQKQLSVSPPFGGEHALMNTHNHLMKLGTDEFLEVISINPAAPKPERPRWFALDHFNDDTPRLITWVTRTDNFDAAMDATQSLNWQALTVSRGELTWRIAVPEDGSLPFDGVFPTIIEWPMRPLPGSKMADFNCSLKKLQITHPEAHKLEAHLLPLIDDQRITITQGESARISALIDTPDGPRELT